MLSFVFLRRAFGRAHDRRAQHVVRVQITAAHAFVDHVGDAHRGTVPAHVHADLHEHRDDAGVLADRPLAFGAHAAVGQDLRDRVLRGRALFEFVCAAERLDVVERVVVADVLQRIRNALDQVFLFDDGHGLALGDGTLVLAFWRRSVERLLRRDPLVVDMLRNA